MDCFGGCGSRNCSTCFVPLTSDLSGTPRVSQAGSFRGEREQARTYKTKKLRIPEVLTIPTVAYPGVGGDDPCMRCCGSRARVKGGFTQARETQKVPPQQVLGRFGIEASTKEAASERGLVGMTHAIQILWPARRTSSTAADPIRQPWSLEPRERWLPRNGSSKFFELPVA